MKSQKQKQIQSPSKQYNLKSALLDFNTLKNSKTLPQKMEIKLQYLQNKLLNLPTSNQKFKQLPDYQINSLQQCDQQSKKKLFISIVKCLSGKQIIIYFKDQKIYYKKQQGFTIWHKYYLSCDSQKLWIKKKVQTQKIYKQYMLKDIKISKKYLQYKNKMCFGLMYIGSEEKKHKDKYMIGFDQETACQRVFKSLKQLLLQNQSKQNKIQIQIKDKADKNQKKSTKVINNKVINKQFGKIQHFQQQNNNKNYSTNQNILSKKQKQIHSKQQKRQRKNSESYLQYQRQIQFEEEIDEQQYQNQNVGSSDIINFKQLRQKQQQILIKEQIKKEPFSTSFDKDFKLIKNFQLGRILYNQKDNRIKMTVLLSNIDIQQAIILQTYLQMKNWNLEIQEYDIINKISKNSYKIFIKFKKYSIVSLPRWVYLTLTCIQTQKKTYLLLRSCDNLTEQQMLKSSVSTVQMKLFNQTIQLCKRNQNDNRILMTIITQIDFGGYCSKSDNLNMGLYILGNLNNFYNLLIAESISKSNDQINYKRLFDLEQGENKKYQKKDIKINQSQLLSPSKTNISQNTSNSNHKKIKNASAVKSQKSSQFDQQQEIDVQQFQFSEYKNINKNNKIGDFSNKKTVKYQQKQIKAQNKSKQQQINQFLNLFQSYIHSSKPSQKLVKFFESQFYGKHYLKHKFEIDSKFIPSSKQYVYKDQIDNWVTQNGKWRIQKQQLVFIDQQILTRQKNVIKLILKQISTNVMAGKSIMSMSMPVEIFQQKSFLEKCACSFGFLPYYFDKAIQQKNIVKQIQYVATAIGFSASVIPNIEKPFNPILGQTYQCKIGGVNFYLQQVCHHPPITAFYVKTNEYEFSGSFNPHIDMGLNSVLAKNISPFRVKFYKTQTSYIGYSQDFQISGLMFGDRKLRSSGKAIILQQINEILCQLSYGKMKKNVYENKKIRSGQIVGGIYKVSNNFSKRLKSSNIKTFDGLKNDQKIQEMAKMRGNWLGEFFVNEQNVKTFSNPVPYCPVKQLYVLPSDCTYRLDCYYKRQNDLKKSQQWKEIMENKQRKDRKLRQEYGSSH